METMSPPQLRTAISANYAELSDTLRIAADYIAENQVEIATRSLRVRRNGQRSVTGKLHPARACARLSGL